MEAHLPGRLEGKIAVITGAGSVGPGWGNGKATAVLFAREGAKIIASDIRYGAAEQTRDLILNEGGDCTAIEVDVTDEKSVNSMVDRAVAYYGRVDILHNNVGTTGKLGGPTEIEASDWDDIFAVNAKSMYLTTRAVLPVMRRSAHGAIVNVSSIAAIRHTGIPYVAYAASKAAILQLTQTIAIEHARHGIRCNAILPGLMNTPMIRAEFPDHYGDIDEMLEKRNRASPTGHMGDAWDVAYGALFLASDEAKYVNGARLVIDGGLTARVG